MDPHYIIQTYGYWALLLGTFLEGETILVIAGFAAHRGHLSLLWVIVFACIGTLLGDQLFFFIGRYHGTPFINKTPTRRARAERALRLIDKYGNWIILGFRFVYGLRTITPFAIGISRVKTARFAILNVIAAIVWSCAVGIGGYLFGEILERVMGRYEWAGIALVASLGLSIWLYHIIRWRRQDKIVRIRLAAEALLTQGQSPPAAPLPKPAGISAKGPDE